MVTKLGLSLAQQTSAWFKACGKSSILQTKRPTVFNSELIGYIRPNGEIAFRSNEQALNFARQEIVKALKSETPYEKAVVIKDNVIKGIFNGDKHCVATPEITERGYYIIHGHPKSEYGVSTPISVPDAVNLLQSKHLQTRIIACNHNGEFSELAIKATPKKLFSSDITGDTSHIVCKKVDTDAITNYVNKLGGIRPKTGYVNTDEHKINIMRKLFNCYILKGKLGKQYDVAIKEGNQELASSIYSQAQHSRKGVQRIHDFWKDFADVFDMKYTTNYSYLT